MFLTFFLALLVGGKLSDDNGFRGLHFGPDSVLATSPMEGCTENPAEGVRWTCSLAIGGQPVTASYMASQGLFSGMHILGSGYSSCNSLKDVLTAAWGTPRQDNEYIEKYTWIDGKVLATFEYKEIDKDCTILIANMDVFKQVERAQQEAAKKGVGDL